VKLTLTPAATALLSTLQRAGAMPLVVGGAVRDALAGRPVKDVDIEVFGLQPSEVAAALAATPFRVDNVGRSFGVTKVQIGDESFDVALPRTETSTGPGHLAFTTTTDPFLPVQTALARRDFTINAMAVTTDGFLLDPFRGADDLQRGILRHTSAAFAEDPLRVLRGMQFAARFQLSLHPTTATLCASLAPAFGTISIERIWTEFEKLAQSPAPGRGVTVLRQTGWDQFFPEFTDGDAADRAAQTTGKEGSERTALILACLLNDCQKPSQALRKIGAPNLPCTLVRGYTGLPEASQRTVAISTSLARQLARQLSKSGLTMRDWIEFRDAVSGGGSVWLRPAQEGGVLDAPLPLIVTGQFLLDRGIEPGPRMGKLIQLATLATDAGIIYNTLTTEWWLQRQLDLVPLD